jgi:hypothetical protein
MIIIGAFRTSADIIRIFIILQCGKKCPRIS